jgi:hypothetical protein
MQIGSRLPSVIVAIVLIFVSGQAQSANPVGDLLNGCQILERGKRGTGQMVHIPKSKGALVCWGYMKAMQDLSVWVDENGNKILGSCPPERTTTLDLVCEVWTFASSPVAQQCGLGGREGIPASVPLR